MSQIQCRVGSWTICWKTIPRGMEGVSQVEVKSSEGVKTNLEVRWKRDINGLWLSLPYGLVGFDLNARKEDDGAVEYEVVQREVPAQWTRVSVSYGEAEAQATAKPKSKALRVRAQMPGKIIRILINEGDAVEKNQPIVVMEAMKMENEIRAVQSGKVSQIKVTQGQTVETGADLVLLID